MQFDEVTLIIINQQKNKHGEIIETESRLPVPIEIQTVKRETREKYNERGAGRYMRFKVSLFGPQYNQTTIPYFIHEGTRYGVTDFVRDTTGTSYYIEGTSASTKGMV